jgi:hypothetical protein
MIQTMSDQMSEVYNKFGDSYDYHPPLISYEHEMISNLIIKTIETDNIDPETKYFWFLVIFLIFEFLNLSFFLYLIYFKSIFWKPSSINPCKNDLQNFCSCKFNNSCMKCGDLEKSHMGTTIRIRDKTTANPCSKPPINRGIDFSQNKFLTNFQNAKLNGSGQFRSI